MGFLFLYLVFMLLSTIAVLVVLYLAVSGWRLLVEKMQWRHPRILNYVLGAFSLVLSVYVLVFLGANVGIVLSKRFGEVREINDVLQDNLIAHYWESDTPRWTPDGAHIVFGRRDSIYRVTSSGSRLDRIVDPSWMDVVASQGYPDAIPDTLGPFFEADYGPSISLDGTRIAYSTYRLANWTPFGRRNSLEIVTSNLDGSDVRRLTSDGRNYVRPTWSPDGTRIAFETVENRREARHVYTMALDGSDRRYALSGGSSTPFWSPSGDRIAQWRDHVLYTATQSGGYTWGNWRRVSEFSDETYPAAWSPDGSRLVFASVIQGHTKIYTVNSAGAETTEVIDLGARDLLPHNLSWSPDGNEILFGSRRLYVVAADGSALRTMAGPAVYDYHAAWSPDGSRIAVHDTYREYWNALDDDHYSYSLPALFTMARDGSDNRLLVSSKGWVPSPANGSPLDDGQSATTIYFDGAGPTPTPFDIEQCSNGVVVPNHDVNPRVVEDCETLLRIRDSLGANPPLNWSTDTTIFNWAGIVLGNAGVGSLLLPNRDLTGVISSEFGNLSGLTELDLSGNWLSGKIPSELGNLSNLEKLDLSRNVLSGSIPSTLGNLTNLQQLNLGYNNLNGNIPSQLRDLSSIENLDLSHNSLGGNIPSVLGSLKNLRSLNLSYNNLNGNIPSELFNTSFSIDLLENPLEGCIPRELRRRSGGRLPRLSVCED